MKFNKTLETSFLTSLGLKTRNFKNIHISLEIKAIVKANLISKL